MFSHLLLLLLLGTGLSAIEQFTPPSISETTKKASKLEFTFQLPKICIECCVDVMFILDRSSSVIEPGNDKRIHWNRMKSIAAQLVADPLNRPRVRTAAMQMGDPTKVTTAELTSADGGAPASGDTGIRFELKTGPFPESINNWGDNDIFSTNDQAAWGTAAEVALEHFKGTPDPWVVDASLKTRCDPANHARVMIWMVDGGPHPSSNDPCTMGLMPRLREEGIQQHIVGVIPDSNKASFLQSRSCMFSSGADTSKSLVTVPQWANLLPEGKQCQDPPVPQLFEIEPCGKCTAFLDVVFVLDESGSMCDNIEGNSSQLSGICPKRTEFDLQVKFVGQIIAELGKNWNNHRVSIWTFATKMRPWLKLGGTGALSAQKYANGRPTYASTNPLTEPQVQAKLEEIKDKFSEGWTATALAYNQALGEIEFAPPRADGVKPKKVVIFLSDGGPNPPLYTVDEFGKRTTCPSSSGGSVNNNCFHWKKFWDGTTEAAQKGQMNMAVCADDGDAQPHWVRWREKTSGGHERYIEQVKTYADAAPTLDLTLLMLMVGHRADEHINDIKCLVSKPGAKGGYLTAKSFAALTSNEANRRAFLRSMCTGVPLGQARGVLAKWAEYEVWQEQEVMAKFSQILAKEQLQISPVQTSSVSSYVWSGALVIGVGVASFLYGKKTRAEYDYTPLLLDTESV